MDTYTSGHSNDRWIHVTAGRIRVVTCSVRGNPVTARLTSDGTCGECGRDVYTWEQGEE